MIKPDEVEVLRRDDAYDCHWTDGRLEVTATLRLLDSGELGLSHFELQNVGVARVSPIDWRMAYQPAVLERAVLRHALAHAR